jgi:hypothetical protein
VRPAGHRIGAGSGAVITGSPLSRGWSSRRATGRCLRQPLEDPAVEGGGATSTPTKSPTKWSRLQRSGETHETRAPRSCSSGTLVRPTETYETSAMQLPRWGSRVRVPSSAPERALTTCSFASDEKPQAVAVAQGVCRFHGWRLSRARLRLMTQTVWSTWNVVRGRRGRERVAVWRERSKMAYTVSSALMARRSSMARYPSAT